MNPMQQGRSSYSYSKKGPAAAAAALVKLVTRAHKFGHLF